MARLMALRILGRVEDDGGDAVVPLDLDQIAHDLSSPRLLLNDALAGSASMVAAVSGS